MVALNDHTLECLAPAEGGIGINLDDELQPSRAQRPKDYATFLVLTSRWIPSHSCR